ncbi:MAG: hypothetical protein CUN55_11710 [Phototrophicales bacterium]|nr:MAG: hypothetical protein CUN55_11710 [Phototrophicales bacterium]
MIYICYKKLLIKHNITLVLLFILSQFLLDLHTPTTAQEPNLSSNPIGIIGGYWRPEAAEQLSVGWDRIIFDWSRFQPNGPGDFVADAVRPSWIERNQQQGREVVGLIINTPAWASATPRIGVPNGLFLPYDDPGNLWGVFLTQLAEQYAPLGIHHWIIWNNIDIPSIASNTAFIGDIAEYAQMVKIAYQAFNAVDENAKIYLGGINWWYDVSLGQPPYLSRLIERIKQDDSAALNNYYFDGVTLNFIIEPTPVGIYVPTTETFNAVISETRRILVEEGLSTKPIWIHEMGATVTQDDLRALPNATISINPQQQAYFLVQGLALGLANGAERVGIYRLFDNNFVVGEPAYGLLRDDNTARPAFAALQYITQLIIPYQQVEYGNSTNARLVTFTQETQTIFIMWSAAEKPVSFWIEQAFQDNIDITDIYGNPLQSPRLGVGPEGVSVYVIDTSAAIPDPNDNIWISGAPIVVIIDTTQPRRVWGSLGDAVGIQLR